MIDEVDIAALRGTLNETLTPQKLWVAGVTEYNRRMAAINDRVSQPESTPDTH